MSVHDTQVLDAQVLETHVLDTHVHVWDTAVFDYPWLAGVPALPARALPDDVDRTAGATTRMIFVEADRLSAQAPAEARWVARLDWPELAGIVAAADLTASDASRLDDLARLDRVVGIRHSLQDTPADLWDVPRLAEGLDELARRGLTFDACVRYEQLPALADLLARVPDARVVLDHLGKPPVDAGIDTPQGRDWVEGVHRLARLPHTYVKVSGLAAEATDAAAFARGADAFIAAGVEAFGPARSMIGSDWPVSARTGAGTSMTDWVRRVRRATGASGEEWSALAARSGAAFYRV